MSTLMRIGARAATIVLLLSSGVALGQQAYTERALIALQSDRADFREVVAAIRNPATKTIADTDIERSSIYFRLTERRFVMSDGAFNNGSHLGGGPYVFLTVPEAGYGRSLYEIYSDLGYDAEGVLRQRGKNMVALVLRYERGIRFTDSRDGAGPLNDRNFKEYVYVPTWKNAFALFARLAGETMPDGADRFLYLSFDNEADRNLARFFPAEHREHIASLPYPFLRMAGGPDWDYRQLLENRMGMNSHFRGVGITENTLSPADNRMGLPEFVGPNRALRDLPDYAVIDMGRMEFNEVHD